MKGTQDSLQKPCRFGLRKLIILKFIWNKNRSRFISHEFLPASNNQKQVMLDMLTAKKSFWLYKINGQINMGIILFQRRCFTYWREDIPAIQLITNSSYFSQNDDDCHALSPRSSIWVAIPKGVLISQITCPYQHLPIPSLNSMIILNFLPVL